MGQEKPDKPATASEVLARAPGRDDADQEVDVWWGAYSSRALLPSFAVCGVLTALIGAGAAYAWQAYDLPALPVRYTAYALVGAIWAVQLGRWALRVLTKTFRLTSRRLFLERTFAYGPFLAVELSRVTDVRVVQSPLERRLKVGRLQISSPDLASPILLEGVSQPGDLAIEFRARIQQARDAGAAAPPLNASNPAPQ
jgi:hypothetical protein